jgi:hypothetical protein
VVELAEIFRLYGPAYREKYGAHMYVVPGGGLAADGDAWRPARDDFLLPVRALSVLFRAKFRDALQKTELFAQVPAEAWTQDWVVHCQPVGDGSRALKYLAPYIFRVAISNRRILSLDDDQVTFGYTDGRSGQRKTCTVGAEEFIRRFLQHVLPKGFAKVRYYGFYSPNQRDALSRVQELLQAPSTSVRKVQQSLDHPSDTTDFTCPGCGKPMHLVCIIRPRSRCPPEAIAA